MGITIAGTGSYLPNAVITNTRLVETLSVNEQWIVDKTGIKERRMAAPTEATSDLATFAAVRALRSAGVSADDVDLIILATANPDQPIPATACFVQANIGATRAASFDIMAACAGFVFAVATAHDMMSASNEYRTALVIGSDIYSRSVDYTDKKTCVLLGDGAGAIVLQKVSNNDSGILAKRIFSDGNYTKLAEIPAGGTRNPSSIETIRSRGHYLKMRGREVRSVVDGLLDDLISDLLRSANIELTDVTLIVPHQMNGAMLNAWAGYLSVESNIIHQTVSWSGNTGAASVAIALDDAVKKQILSVGDIVVLVAFGAGLTWGGIVLKWHGSVKRTIE